MNSPLLKIPTSKGSFEVYSEKPRIEFRKVHQVHSNIVIEVNDQIQAELVMADGMISYQPQTLAIVTADCFPILLEGDRGVAFLHAGWRGIHQKIVQDQALHLISPTHCTIGPSIRQCCFEVGEEFKNIFRDSPHFIHNGERLTFDLLAEVRDQLNLMFTSLDINVIESCTCCDSKYHSYRRDKTSNRNWNLYIPTAE